MIKKNYLICFAVLSQIGLYGGLEGFKVIQGEATAPVVDSEGAMIIKSGKQAIIEWDKFSLGESEIARFLQQDKSSSLLNRVVGNESSSLLGRLESNGHLYLINPNGVLIGPSGQIICESFIGSTFDILNENFLSGKNLSFLGTSENAIINHGKIVTSQGDILLIARYIENKGELIAEGNVGLVSSEVVMKPSDENIFIRLTSSEIVEDLTKNLQNGQSPYSYAISQEGLISASSIQSEQGKIYLIASEGSCYFSGAAHVSSGEVRIHAPEAITVIEEAIIDVSGKQGGQIYVGGEPEGAAGPYPSAQSSFIEKGSLLIADGSESHGGLVIVYGDNEATFHGLILNRALGPQGHGGDAEVSADIVTLTGHADLRSLTGKSGHFLIDPSTTGPVVIDTSGGSGPNTFGDSYINTQLGLGNFSIVTTNTSPGNGNISLQPGINIAWSTPNTFSLTADAQISVNSCTISSTSSSGNFTAIDWEAKGLLGSSTTQDGITIDTDVTISSVDGNINLTGTAGTQTSGNSACGINISSPLTCSGAGAINLTGTGGSLGSSSHGILINNTELSTSNGIINLAGTGQGSGSNISNNFGIYLDTSTLTTSGSGNIELAGTASPPVGNFTYTTNDGVSSGTTASSITCSGTGTILISGTGAAIGSSTNGISLNQGGSLSTTSGNIYLQGTVGQNQNPGSSNTGVRLVSNVSTTSGTVSIQGAVASSGTGNQGIYFSDYPISINNGNLSVTGTVDSGSSNRGILLNSSNATNMVISSTGGPLSFTGTVTNQTGNSRGILVQGTGTNVTTITSNAGGNISFTGDASSSSGNNNIGLLFNTLSAVTYTGTSSAGTLTLTGTGGPVQDTGNPSYGITIVGPTASIDSSINNALPIVVNAHNSGSSTQSLAIQNGGYILAGANLTVTTDQDLIINGPTASDACSYLGANGNANYTIGGNIQLTGGTASQAGAQIGNFIAPYTGDIHFLSVGGTITLGNTSPAGYSVIGHGTLTSQGNRSGNIYFDSVGSDVYVLGNTNAGSGNFGFSQIGHCGGFTDNTTNISGNINILSHGSIYVVGGTASSTGYGLIGHSNEGDLTWGPCEMTLIADHNISLTSNAAQAEIINSSEPVQDGSTNGNITLVVDNLYASAPNYGSGAFTLNSVLSATGQLKIYTSVRSQNTINDQINGVTFVPGTLYVDSTTEEWNTYYPGGTYDAPAFKIYYKNNGNPTPPPPPPTPPNPSSNTSTGNTNRRNNLSPALIPLVVDIESKRYLGRFSLCGPFSEKGSWCAGLGEQTADPRFAPFGSFIFEDGIYYWTLPRPIRD